MTESRVQYVLEAREHTNARTWLALTPSHWSRDSRVLHSTRMLGRQSLTHAGALALDSSKPPKPYQ